MRQTALMAGVVVLVASAWAVAHGAEPPKAEAKERVIKTKAGDFHIVTDRDESVADFIRQHRVLVGGLSLDGGGKRGDLKAILAAEKDLAGVWLHHPSLSDDPDAPPPFVTEVTVAPPTPAVAKLLAGVKKEDGARFTLILCRDEAGSAVYRPVGFTTHTPVGFFTDKFSGKVDGVEAKDLRFVPPAKK